MNVSVASSMRLDRLLANLGYGSRRDVHRLVACSLVTLDGKPVKDADQRVVLAPDLTARMWVEGQPLDPLPGMILMVNKPLGMTCSHKEHGALIYDLFPERWRRRVPPLSTVGRLDKETSGFLLLTDIGEFLHRIISPKSHVRKRYQVTLAQPLRGHEEKLFASGEIRLEDDPKPLLPARLEPLSDVTCSLTISEGRYHQIRRMFAAIGNEVITLHRDQIGALTFPADLKEGEYRFLTASEIKILSDKEPAPVV